MSAAPAPFVPGSASASSPPFSLPGSHFAAAMVFFVGGAVGLVVVAPMLARGAYLLPRVVAVTHLFTLGWITTSIMGALYQFLPVALGQPIRWIRVARATFWLYVPGLAVFVTGMAWYHTGVIALGAAAFGTGILLFIVNLAATLRASRRSGTPRDVTWWALTAACSFLALTLVVGWALAANLRWGFMGGERLVALATHLHIALVGWVLLVIVGVGHRLLPMFLLSHGAGDRAGKVAVALLSAGVLLLFALHHVAAAGVSWAWWLPGIFMAAGAGAFLAQAWSFYRHRRRRALDPGMSLAAVALLVVGAAVAFGLVALATGFVSARLATAYVLLLILGFSLFVAAHHYKIVPFLVWYHRFGPLAGRRPVPTVSQLYSAPWARAAGLLLSVGVVGLASAITLGSVPAARVGAALFATGALLEATQILHVARRRPA